MESLTTKFQNYTCNTYLSVNSRKADLEKWECELAKYVLLLIEWTSHDLATSTCHHCQILSITQS